jgi:branched-chain amino acid transport system substrate-binding protein
MQVKFASAAISKASVGEASTGGAAASAAASAGRATIVPPGQAALRAAIRGLFKKHNEKMTPMASRFNKDTQPCGARSLTRTRALAAIACRRERVQRSAGTYERIMSANMWSARQAALEIGAKILAGNGVRAGKVMDSAYCVVRHRVSSRAASTLAMQRQDADFEMPCEARFRMQVRIHAPFVFDTARAVTDALKRADSVETPKLPETTQASREGAQPGPVILGGNGVSKEGAATLHDFKDSAGAVLDVVQVY